MSDKNKSKFGFFLFFSIVFCILTIGCGVLTYKLSYSLYTSNNLIITQAQKSASETKQGLAGLSFLAVLGLGFLTCHCGNQALVQLGPQKK